MNFKVGDIVRRKDGFSTPGYVGKIVEMSLGINNAIAYVKVDGHHKRYGWYTTRIELIDQDYDEVDE